MVSLSKSHPELAIEFDEVLTRSIEAATRGERWIVDAVNRSGYQAQSIEEARELCESVCSTSWRQRLTHRCRPLLPAAPELEF